MLTLVKRSLVPAVVADSSVPTADNDEIVEDVPDVPSLTISSKRTAAGAIGSRKTSRRK